MLRNSIQKHVSHEYGAQLAMSFAIKVAGLVPNFLPVLGQDALILQLANGYL